MRKFSLSFTASIVSNIFQKLLMQQTAYVLCSFAWFFGFSDLNNIGKILNSETIKIAIPKLLSKFVVQ